MKSSEEDFFYVKSNNFLKKQGETCKDEYIDIIKRLDIYNDNMHSLLRSTFTNIVDSGFNTKMTLLIMKSYIAAIYIRCRDESIIDNQSSTKFFHDLISDVKDVDIEIGGQVERFFNE